jgi:carboxymethylenebutenolidase
MMNAKTVVGVWLAVVLALTACQSDEDTATGTANDAAYVEEAAHAHAEDTPAAAPLASEPVTRELLEQELAYGEAGNSNLLGYLAMPADALEPLPGVIVIHEWWGLNDNIKAMTRRLAAEGFVVLAVDLYGGEIATTPEDAERLMAGTMDAPETTLGNLRQAYDYLDKYALAPSIATVGWCLGGTWSLRTALAMPENLDAMVMYYGQAVTEPAQLERLDMPILGLFAELDESIPVREAQLFRARLLELGKQSTVYIYSDVGHAFANPSGATYDAEAAEDAWQTTIEFLKTSL